MATQVFQITISTHPSLSGAFTWSSFISNTCVVGKVETPEMKMTHDFWHLLTQYVEHLKGMVKFSLEFLDGFHDWKKNVSRQKACSIPLKIWYFQSKSSRWQGQWCLYWSPKLFLHPSNLCFPPPIWPWSSTVGYAKINFGKQTKDFICEIHRF